MPDSYSSKTCLTPGDSFQLKPLFSAHNAHSWTRGTSPAGDTKEGAEPKYHLWISPRGQRCVSLGKGSQAGIMNLNVQACSMSLKSFDLFVKLVKNVSMGAKANPIL